MKIEYKDEKKMKEITSASWINKNFPKGIYVATQDCLKILAATKNIGKVWKIRPSLQMEKKKGTKDKKKGTKDIGKFRVNKSVRIEFLYNNEKDFLQVENIKIIKIHNHKY